MKKITTLRTIGLHVEEELPRETQQKPLTLRRMAIRVRTNTMPRQVRRCMLYNAALNTPLLQPCILKRLNAYFLKIGSTCHQSSQDEKHIKG